MAGFVSSNPFFNSVWQQGVQRGLKPYQIAGLIGNFYGESRGRTDAIGDNGKAIGAAQWNDRAPMLKAFAAKQGTDWRDPITQAKFVFHEGDTTERKAFERLKASKNLEEALAAGISYERPAGFNNPAGWASHPTLHYNTRLKGAQMALGGGGSGDQGPIMALAPKEAPGPQDAAGQAIQGAFGAPGGMGAAEEQPSGWDAMGNIGNGLTAAGAALMAIDNPSGASALMAGIRAQQRLKGQGWNTTINPRTGQAVRYNEQTGETMVMDIPGYKVPEPEKTTSQQDFDAWRAMPPGDAKNAFGKAKGYVEDPVEANLDDATAERLAMMKIKGGKVGAAELGTGKQGNANKKVLEEKVTALSKELGLSPDDVLASQTDIRARNKIADQFGKLETNFANAQDKIEAASVRLRDAFTDYEKSSGAPIDVKLITKLWNTAKDQISDPKLLALKTTIDAYRTDYATALNPQKTAPTVHDLKHAENLLSENMTKNGAMAVIDSVLGEVNSLHENYAKRHQQFFGSPSRLLGSVEDVPKRHDALMRRLHPEKYVAEQQQAAPGGAQAAPAKEAPKQQTIQQLPQGAQQHSDGYYYWQENGKWKRAKAQ